MPTYPSHARVLFDEAHSESWSIRPDLTERMQPSHPADSSLAAAAELLRRTDFQVDAHADGALDPNALANTDVLVIAHPSEPRWEATTGAGSPVFTDAEIDAIERFVHGGGGLVVLGETEEEKYGTNLNDLLARFDLAITSATVQDYEHHHAGAPSWILADLDSSDSQGIGSDPLARIRSACFYRSGTIEARNGARVLARSHRTATVPSAPLAAIVQHGEGRVALLADSDLFGDDCIAELDHSTLWLNLVHWTANAAFRSPAAVDTGRGTELAENPDWIRLKAATEELRLHQSPDGSIDLDASTPVPERLRELTATIAASAAALAPHFPHQGDYIEALRDDLATWADADFPKPDFARSSEALRPERDRADGVVHLVVMPMYKQNASRDVSFETLLVEVPWPEWIAELESTRYSNSKFVPVELRDHTAGYDSECAVLFPETFSVAERPSDYHFGAIFCDREAERFRRVGSAAAEILRLNLPPDAEALLASERLSRDAYILWDLIHDRTHMRGDLPFDPFMIRQRSPYWMYALEELRCDLTAFHEATVLEREGFTFARHIHYALVFDRLFRFPLTGSRVRNYDGLGGQLLFAFLHREGYLHWTDNRMTVDWDGLVDGVERLRERVAELYHSGIDRPKLAQWIAAHDLISEYVPPATSSVWARDRRDLPEVEEPKELVDSVRDDEFPLSLFYSQLAPKLAPALERPHPANGVRPSS